MRLYTAREVAEMLQVHVRTVYRLGKEGQLRSVKVGRSVRFAMPEIGDEYADRKIEEQGTA